MNISLFLYDKKALIIFGFCILAVIILTACPQNKKSIKIGYLATLQGPYSEWGVGGRDGLILAVDYFNETGGQNGRPVEIIVKDVSKYKDRLDTAVDEFIDAGVTILVGPALSSVAVKLSAITNKKGLLLFSHSASSDVLSMQDDLFLRSCTKDSLVVDAFARYTYEKAGWRNITTVFGLDNRSFTESWHNNYKKSFEALGGRLLSTQQMDAKSDFSTIVRNLLIPDPDGIILSGMERNTSLLSQELYLLKSKIPIGIANPSSDYIQNSGAAAEGVLSPKPLYDRNSEQYRAYVLRARKKLGANFLTDQVILGYNAGKILLDGIKNSKVLTPVEIKNAIIRQKTFVVPLGTIIIDQYGDAAIPVYVSKVINGKEVLQWTSMEEKN